MEGSHVQQQLDRIAPDLYGWKKNRVLALWEADAGDSPYCAGG